MEAHVTLLQRMAEICLLAGFGPETAQQITQPLMFWLQRMTLPGIRSNMAYPIPAGVLPEHTITEAVTPFIMAQPGLASCPRQLTVVTLVIMGRSYGGMMKRKMPPFSCKESQSPELCQPEECCLMLSIYGPGLLALNRLASESGPYLPPAEL